MVFPPYQTRGKWVPNEVHSMNFREFSCLFIPPIIFPAYIATDFNNPHKFNPYITIIVPAPIGRCTPETG